MRPLLIAALLLCACESGKPKAHLTYQDIERIGSNDYVIHYSADMDLLNVLVDDRGTGQSRSRARRGSPTSSTRSTSAIRCGYRLQAFCASSKNLPRPGNRKRECPSDACQALQHMLQACADA